MKKLIISIMCLFPLISHAGNTLKDACDAVYIENVEIVGFFASDATLYNKVIIGGVKVKYQAETQDAFITKDNQYLYNVAQTAFITDAHVNICAQVSLENDDAFLLGIETKNSFQ